MDDQRQKAEDETLDTVLEDERPELIAQLKDDE